MYISISFVIIRDVSMRLKGHPRFFLFYEDYLYITILLIFLNVCLSIFIKSSWWRHFKTFLKHLNLLHSILISAHAWQKKMILNNLSQKSTYTEM